MTKDDIMRMAREAGLHSAVLLRIYDDREAALCDSEIAELRKIERFASLVVANINPKSFMSWQEGYEAGVAAERDKLQSAAEWCRMCERKGVFYEKATGDEANSPKVLGEG